MLAVHSRRQREGCREPFAENFAAFRAWFEAFETARLDEHIERDAHGGKLDRPAQQALSDHRAGRCRER